MMRKGPVALKPAPVSQESGDIPKPKSQRR